MDMARKEGESVNFTCVATGVPVPVITWSSDTSDNITAQSDDIMITNNTDGSNRMSVLTLVNPKVEDFQNYTCNATNAFGNDNETALLGSKLMAHLLTILLFLYLVKYVSCVVCKHTCEHVFMCVYKQAINP